MSIELDWHEGDESPGIAWEHASEPLPAAAAPPATIARGQRAQGGAPSWLPRFAVSVLAGVLLGLGILAIVLFWRSDRGAEQARQDIEAATSLVLDAWKNRDILLYSDRLDPSDPVWKSRMIAGLRSMPAPETITVAKVTLDGPIAVAEIAETSTAGDTVRKLAFFRLIDGQWLMAAPQAEHFGAVIAEDSPHFRIAVRQRDEAFLPDLVNMAEGAYVTLCGELRCAAQAQPVSLRLAYEYSSPSTSARRGQVSVLSPWLSGRTPDGRPAAEFEQALVRQLAVQLAGEKAPATAPPLLEAIGDWAATELAGAPMPGAETIPSALQTGALLPLDAVWRQATRQPRVASPLVKAQLHTMLAYAQVSLADDAIGRLLEAGNEPLPTVLQRAFQVDAATFAQEWLRWLSQDLSTPAPQLG